MMRVGRCALALFLVAGFSASLASAASVSFAARSLGFAAVTVPRCTSSALDVTPVLTSANVSGVAVSGLPAACAGATLLLTVHNGTTSGAGSAVVPAGGGSVTVTLGSPTALATSTRVDLLLQGP
jgi:hypothetical protein